MTTDTRLAVHTMGHRAFTGGTGPVWDKIGDLQFSFLVEQGLQPSDYFIDVACGGLRGGARFINYLQPDHYLGVDKFIELVIYGVAEELGATTFREKRPRFVISDSFEFEKSDLRPTFGIAQSLFSHLTEADARLCLTKLRTIAADGCRFFVTFHEVDTPVVNPAQSHSRDWFGFTRGEMESFGADAGWTPRYIGPWNHPRKQHIIEYVAS